MKQLSKALVDKLTAIANTQMEPQGWDQGAMPSAEDSYDEGRGDGRIELAREVVRALGIKVTARDPDNDDRCMLCDEWFPPGKGGVEEVEGKGYFACKECRKD